VAHAHQRSRKRTDMAHGERLSAWGKSKAGNQLAPAEAIAQAWRRLGTGRYVRREAIEGSHKGGSHRVRLTTWFSAAARSAVRCNRLFDRS
jgi:hypothetical protein